MLLVPLGGQRGEAVGGQLDCSLVVAPVVMRLLEIRRSQNAESQVPEASGDFQRPGPRHERLVQLAEMTVGVRQESGDPTSAAVVVECLGEGLGLAQTLQQSPDLTELAQHWPQLEADLEALLQRGRANR